MGIYMLSIHKCKRNVETTQEDLECILSFLSQNGVHLYYAIHENHGLYKQLHTHVISKYIGRYKKLTKYKLNNIWYAIHWTPLIDYSGAMSYLEKTAGHIVSKSSTALG